MAKESPESEAKLTYARETLEATPARVVQLLRGIATSLPIRAYLVEVGLTRADLEEGWLLLRAACELPPGDLVEHADSRAVAQLVTELDAWDERGFHLVRASLSHGHPEQLRFLLGGLQPIDGPEAVQGIVILLDRLDALESDPKREPSRADDHDALQALARRGLGPAQRVELRERCARVASATAGPLRNTRTVEASELQHLTRLRAWYDEWAELCRVVLKRKELLERVGLGG